MTGIPDTSGLHEINREQSGEVVLTEASSILSLETGWEFLQSGITVRERT